jgi:hypothetical protein
MTKPISEWTDDEVEDNAEIWMTKPYAAEVLRLREALARVKAECADLCTCDFEREEYATQCDPCRIRAAIEGEQ